MAEFQYKAKDPSGRVKTGKLNANSKKTAKARLQKMRLKPMTLKATKLDADDHSEPKGLEKFFYKDEKGRLQIELGEQQPSSRDVIVFTKQFATMLNSGVALVQALGLLADQQKVRSFGRVLRQIRQAVENGAALSEAMEANPKIFDTLYIAMVRAGETSGNLDVILMKLVTYIEKSAKIKSQVKSAMWYPGIVVVVASIVVTALLVFVVPTFAQQYESKGAELPGLTQFVIDMSNGLQNYWYYFLGGIALFITGIGYSYKNTAGGRRVLDKLLLNLPGVGSLIQKVAVGRFCSTMSTMLGSGVNLLEALDICSASSGNVIIEEFINGVRKDIEEGSRLSEPLGEGELFPDMVVSMIAVGETTGALDDMLAKVSEFYEEEVDQAVKTVLSMIEPILIVVIGAIVGTIVIAMYLPIFDLGKIVNQ